MQNMSPRRPRIVVSITDKQALGMKLCLLFLKMEKAKKEMNFGFVYLASSSFSSFLLWEKNYLRGKRKEKSKSK